VNLFGKEITPKSPPLFVAEISCNHGGSLERAKDTMLAAKLAGADAVKIQCYTPDEMTTNNGFLAKGGPWDGRDLYALYYKTQTPLDWMESLFDFAETNQINLFASVFGEDGLQRLEYNHCPAYKIASFEFNDTELITKVVKTGKPLLLSTGTATPEEINRAISIINPANSCLMHCVSKYPHPLDEANLWKIDFLKGFYPIVVGFSDHCDDMGAMLGAVAKGAKIIEKHFQNDTLGVTSEDQEFSLYPEEFEHYKKMGLAAWSAGQKTPYDTEKDSRQFRRSLYVVKDIKEGEMLTPENIRSIRPSYGMEPYKYKNVLGRVAKTNIKAGTPLKGDMYYD